ncbi:5033_t:CDS:2, partial [Gigaspora margarita]
ANGEERGNKILNGEEDSPEPPNNRQDNSERNTEPSGSNFKPQKQKKRKLEHSKIDTYLAKSLTYAYLNPNLHLPDRRTLTGKTLNMVSDDIASYPEKVFQMSCIYASLLYEERITQIKKKMFLKQNAALPIYDDNQESILLNDEEDEITDLLDKDTQEDEEVYNFDLDIDNIDHPAINNATK